MFEETDVPEYQLDYEQIIERMKKTFRSGRTLSYEFRLKQLKSLKRMLIERADEITDALYKDLRKPKLEGGFYEIEPVKAEIINAIRDLKKWMEPKRLPVNLVVATDRAEVHDDPYGLVLIIGAWNYPFLLTINPLYGAIAGGNCVIVKPSEIASHSAAKVAELIPQYLDPDCYKVIQGGVRETNLLLQNKFDYIFSTSSINVGKIVMAAAAKYLTPVTLELGGKTPVYIEDSADISESARRILWGKILNAGQTCVAPDYILCSKRTEGAIISKFKKHLKRFYGTDDLQLNGDLTRIINKTHFKKLKNLIIETQGDIVIGGDTDIDDLWISPTIIVNVKEFDVLMEDEIFGPILPILTCNSPEEALTFINSRPKPLSISLFTKNKTTMKLFKERSSSGSLVINDVCVHSGFEGLPFGGVGDSGIGGYHWQYSYDTFVHKKAILNRNFGVYGKISGGIRYPPYEYGKLKIKLLRFVLRVMRYLNLPMWPSKSSIVFRLILLSCFYYFIKSVFNL